MHFTKVHGLGNDFVLIDDRHNAIADAHASALGVRLCNRRTGVGADGLLLIKPSKTCDVCMKLINADGSEAEMCGNGSRAFAKYCRLHGIVTGEEFTMETLAGVMRIRFMGDSVQVNMGRPVFTHGMGLHRVRAEELEFDLFALTLGVPHAVVRVQAAADFPVTQYGPIIEINPLFPNKTNVNFVTVTDRENITVRTWERGCGATLACGTGASATAVACAAQGLTNRQVTIHLALGDLSIDWTPEGDVYMGGPATIVFEGEIQV